MNRVGAPANEPCTRCERTEGVVWYDRMTAYYWDGTGEDPNRPIALCNGPCAAEYRQIMLDLWAEYRSGIGV